MWKVRVTCDTCHKSADRYVWGGLDLLDNLKGNACSIGQHIYPHFQSVSEHVKVEILSFDAEPPVYFKRDTRLTQK
ncbi:MAG: hypothetical protein FJ109_18920 [Deltaproteobacteria bacterium]|nr:hypothetical protein [Deltaproteobacteria bacterium]